jgi:hypothetical protein
MFSGRYMYAWPVVLLALQACATMPKNSDIDICRETPESPAKQSCVKRLLPNVRSVLFANSPTLNPYWSNLYISWSDYLGVHDDDYHRAVEIKETLRGGDQVRGQNRTKPDDGYFAMAGYFNSLGAKWNGYANQAREVGESCISRVGGCQAVDQ